MNDRWRDSILDKLEHEKEINSIKIEAVKQKLRFLSKGNDSFCSLSISLWVLLVNISNLVSFSSIALLFMTLMYGSISVISKKTTKMKYHFLLPDINEKNIDAKIIEGNIRSELELTSLQEKDNILDEIIKEVALCSDKKITLSQSICIPDEENIDLLQKSIQIKEKELERVSQEIALLEKSKRIQKFNLYGDFSYTAGAISIFSGVLGLYVLLFSTNVLFLHMICLTAIAILGTNIFVGSSIKRSIIEKKVYKKLKKELGDTNSGILSVNNEVVYEKIRELENLEKEIVSDVTKFIEQKHSLESMKNSSEEKLTVSKDLSILNTNDFLVEQQEEVIEKSLRKHKTRRFN